MPHNHGISQPQGSCTQTGQHGQKPEMTKSQARFVHLELNELTNAGMLRYLGTNALLEHNSDQSSSVF